MRPIKREPMVVLKPHKSFASNHVPQGGIGISRFRIKGDSPCALAFFTVALNRQLQDHLLEPLSVERPSPSVHEGSDSKLRLRGLSVAVRVPVRLICALWICTAVRMRVRMSMAVAVPMRFILAIRLAATAIVAVAGVCMTMRLFGAFRVRAAIVLL
mmetsp:Transcript_48785/g.76154  ORF Transcript_48785/g.76154 Transcript_48785/m.76154 type:complete len:157 (-) Transcript_48785:32-502(-)